MLELKKIKKSYRTGEFQQTALKEVSLKFRKNEFVSILGPSGSGKTTLLNIIGGLDRYDSGDLIINNKSTKRLKDIEWDAYRNNCVGFIFQNYNLIPHISVLENVEMGMTLSGVSVSEKRKKAMDVLKRVGLEQHAHKRPNQLSGGQMQRVAIARALANDPDIILADEPTGALDSETSVQIMNLIQEIAKDKLVIMVTHNPELAEKYSTRIVELKDGELIKDSNPITEKETQKEQYRIKKTAMSFFTALKLSFNNIVTKKGRTALTAFASSIGIIGIALILSLSNGFDLQIDKFEKDTLSSMPIIVSSQAAQLDEETMMQMYDEMAKQSQRTYTDKKEVYPQKPIEETMIKKNILSQEYLEYINQLDPKNAIGVSYTRMTSLNLIANHNGIYKPIGQDSLQLINLPKKLQQNAKTSVLEENYDLLEGTIGTEVNELMLMVDSRNQISTKTLEALGLDSEKESISFQDLIGKEIKLILNNDYYKPLGEYFTLNPNFEELYKKESAISLKITGIIRGKKDNKMAANNSGLTYNNALMEEVIRQNANSDIVKLQQEKDYNVLTGEKFDLTTKEGIEAKENLLVYLGAYDRPVMISIYPRNFEAKDQITEYLDAYNKDKEADDKVVYTDYAKTMAALSGNIMDAITVVLIAFSAISLVVSSIMIGIITYISVLERTKEIGILRALGARKKDIKRVFNAETTIIGLCSGLLGILIARLLVFPTNIIIEALTELPNVAKLNPLHALLLITISVILTVIGGAIPARVASKKDPVEALRSE